MTWPTLTKSTVCFGAIFAAGFLSFQAGANPPPARPDLTGRVEMDDGQPAKATVVIYSATANKGARRTKHSSFSDDKKRAKTDANGDFKIPSLDPKLVFRVLIVSDGCRPQFVNKVNPADGPLYVSMEKRDISKVPPNRTVRGRVLDAKGTPIEAACVEAAGATYEDGHTEFGNIQGVDPLAVTDAKGEFVLTSSAVFSSLQLKAEAPGLAPKIVASAAAGGAVNDITLTEGARVTGRVLNHGQPVTNISLSAESTDRNIEVYMGPFEATTDEEGRFTLEHLPPNYAITLTGDRDSLKPYGTLEPQQITTGPDGSSQETGDWPVTPGNRVAGTLVTSDGKPVPRNTRIEGGVGDAWEGLETKPDQNGHFELTGIPKGKLMLRINAPGYHASVKNLSSDRWNVWLKGRVDHDITNLVVLLDKGRERQTGGDLADILTRPETRPLAGIEGAGTNNPDSAWRISGHVTDQKTGKPVATFLVTPAMRRYSRLGTDSASQASSTNGEYTVEVDKRLTDPLLKIEADGYLPRVVPAPRENRNNFDLTLEAGSGPSGTVLSPEGKPASGAYVGLICSGRQDLQVEGNVLRSRPDGSEVQKADGEGHFAFRPEVETEGLAVISQDGFKLVSEAELKQNPKVTLEKWGSIKGTLHRPSGPGTNEILDITFGSSPWHDPWAVNLNIHTTTDSNGDFQFKRVPAGILDLTCRIPMDGRFSGWQNDTLQTVTVAPGQNVELKIEAGKREELRSRALGEPRPLARRVGPAVTGVVLLPDGKPAVDAEVGLVLSNAFASLSKMTLRVGQEEDLKTTTDANGHFSLPGVEGMKGVVAAGVGGFVFTNLSADATPRTIKLEAWGEIHGTLHLGKRLGTNETLVLTALGGNQIFYDYQEYKTTTDDHGRFVITYVPPGEQGIARQVSLGRNGWTQAGLTAVQVKPGGVTEVTLDGTGREIRGSATFANKPEGFDWATVTYSLIEVQTNTAPNRAAFRNTYFRAETPTNEMFDFIDIPAGKYDLTVTAPRSGNGQRPRFGFSQMPIGHKVITVPADDSPGAPVLDVGGVELRFPKELKLGEPAADFSFTTADGKPARLSDYGGKWVLFHFVRFGMNGADDTARLREIYDAYKANEHFAMFGVTFGAANGFTTPAKDNKFPWPLVTLPNYRHIMETAVYMENYSWNRDICFLVGPDGKLAANGATSDEVKRLLLKAFASR
jgi:uncharacterized GH25 family protein/peroxiredoxin